MNYLVKKKDARGRVEILHELHAETLTEAKERFTDWLAAYLVKIPGNRHVAFIPCENGGVVNEADPDFPDTPAIPLPSWYSKEGIYSQDNHLLLAYEYPEAVGNTCLDSFTHGQDRYYFEREKLWTSMEVCEAMRITRRTLLRWVKRGHIVPIRQNEKPSTRKHLFGEREVLRVLQDLPPSAPLRRQESHPEKPI